jgi:hypothetical protein
MDIHKIIESTLKVTEEEMVQANEPAVAAKPEITPELVDSLIADNPELADIDKEMLIKGMTVEMEHFDSVGGDIMAVARVASDHIREFAGKDYYAALEQMEHELKETPGEEKAEHEPGGEEGPAAEEVPAGEEGQPGEEATETPRAETPFESKKEPKESEEAEAKKSANKATEDEINKKAVEKK